MGKHHQVSIKDTFINSTGTLLSRLTGILKMNVVNFFLGRQADAFWSAFRLPNTLRRIVGEGALSNAFIPVYQKEKTQHNTKADRFASTIINLFILITAGLALAGILGAKWFFPLLVSGFAKGSPVLHQAILLNMIMMPFVIEISVFSMLMGILNSHKRFFTPAYAPFFFNLFFILFPIFFYKQLGIYSFGLGVLAGGFAMVVMELVELVHVGFSYHLILDLKHPALKEFSRLYWPSTLNMFILMLNSLISMQFMSYFSGSLTIISNAFIINQAPVGFIGIAIGTVLLPLLSAMDTKTHKVVFQKSVGEGIHLLFYLMVPFVFFIAMFPDTMVNAVYRDLMRLLTGSTGRYTSDLLAQTTKIVALYAMGLLPFALNILFSRVFYAVRDAKTPLFVNIVILLSSFGLYFMSFSPIGFSGIVIADVIAAWIAFGIYFARFYRNYRVLPLPRGFLKTCLVLFIASGVAVLAVFFFHQYITLHFNQPLLLLLLEATEVGLFALIYAGITRLFKTGLRP